MKKAMLLAVALTLGWVAQANAQKNSILALIQG